MQRKRYTKGFTLVELLVVIGIIALLISILLPSLAKARQAAVKISCASRMHQIYLAMAMYAGDNRDALPISVGSSVQAAALTNGFGVGMSPYLGGTFTPATSTQGGGYGKMNKPDHILHCPGQNADLIAPALSFSDPAEFTTYRFPCLPPIDNYRASAGQSEQVLLSAGGWPKFSQLSQPRNPVVFIDDLTSDFTIPGVDTVDYPKYASFQPHGSGRQLGGNTCWGDGSVQWVPVTGKPMVYAVGNGGDPTCSTRIFYMGEGVAGAAGYQWWNQWSSPDYTAWVQPNGNWKTDYNIWGAWAYQAAKGYLY